MDIIVQPYVETDAAPRRVLVEVRNVHRAGDPPLAVIDFSDEDLMKVALWGALHDLARLEKSPWSYALLPVARVEQLP